MRLNIIFSYDVDPTTGEMKYLGKEEITVDTSVEEKKPRKSSSKAKIDENPEPIVTREDNKLVLTQGAVDLLDLCDDCRIDIKYKVKDKKAIPVIGSDKSFSTQGGNKLSKTNTVSYRGKANDKLSEYGTVFKMEPSDVEGVYYLIGDRKLPEIPIPDEIVNLENDLDLGSLEDLDLEEESTDLSKVKFTL